MRSVMTVPLISRIRCWESDHAIEKTGRLHRTGSSPGREDRDADGRAIANAELYGNLIKTEKSLRESNELFSLFMRLSPIYAFIKEVTPTRSIVLQASDNFVQMVGIRGGNMVGKSMESCFRPNLPRR